MPELQKTNPSSELHEIEMRHDEEEGLRELNAGEGVPHDKVFNDLLKGLALESF